MAKTGSLKNPSLKVLQSAKNLKFWMNPHKLTESDFHLYPSFVCVMHSLQDNIQFRGARSTEADLITKLIRTYGFMYSFDLFLGKMNKLKVSSLPPMVRAIIKNREAAEVTATFMESALNNTIVPKMDQQTNLLLQQSSVLNLIANKTLAGEIINFFKTKGFQFVVSTEGTHFTTTWGDNCYNSQTQIESNSSSGTQIKHNYLDEIQLTEVKNTTQGALIHTILDLSSTNPSSSLTSSGISGEEAQTTGGSENVSEKAGHSSDLKFECVPCAITMKSKDQLEKHVEGFHFRIHSDSQEASRQKLTPKNNSASLGKKKKIGRNLIFYKHECLNCNKKYKSPKTLQCHYKKCSPKIQINCN